MGIRNSQKERLVKMHRFFIETPQMNQDMITITGGDVNHIKNVLRMVPGDQICVISGMDSNEYYCEITSLDSSRVDVKVLEIRQSENELENRIILFQGLPKSDKMELIVQKAVELGVTEIVPVAMARSIVKLDAKKEANKLKRWNSIAESAAKQSRRLIIPEVKNVYSYQNALEYAKDLDIKLVPYELADTMERTREIMRSIKPGQSIGIFIGPEGGFETEEVDKAMAIGAQPITLGKRILRTETAGLVTLAMLVYNLER